jgi:hypothetical protein
MFQAGAGTASAAEAVALRAGQACVRRFQSHGCASGNDIVDEGVAARR